MRNKIKHAREIINKALKQVEKECGFTAEENFVINYEVDGSSFVVKNLLFRKTENIEEILNREARANLQSVIYGTKIKLSDLGKTFYFRGEEYRLVNANPRAPKYPFIIEKISTGEEFRAHVSMIEAGFGR